MSDDPISTAGQPAADAATLRGYRDALTETFLGRGRMGQLLGMPLGGMSRDPTLHGFVGFGIGGEDGLSRLIVFAKSETEATDRLQGNLRDAAIPSTTITGVRFVGAGARPVNGGASIGYGTTGGATGTLGCVVRSRKGHGRYGLTCNHVIADLNRASVKMDDVWAPGTAHGGSATDHLGQLHDFAHIDFTAGHSNVIDAALAVANTTADLDPAIAGIGMVAGVNTNLQFGDRVQKSGYVTKHTSGYFWYQINAQISYFDGSTALFRDMLGIVGANGDFADQGDSGALVLDDARHAAGMLVSVASGINLALATAIKPVLDHFDVEIV